MSFFTGYVIGRSGRHSGDAGLGFAGLLVFCLLLLTLGGLIASLLLPLYGVSHLTMGLGNGTTPAAIILIAGLVSLAVITVCYVMAVFGSRIQFIFCGVGLASINAGIIYSLNHCEQCVLSGVLRDSSPSEIMQFAILSAILGIAAVGILRLVSSSVLSEESRSRALQSGLRPISFCLTSNPFLLSMLMLAGMVAALGWALLFSTYQKISEFMEATGQSYQQAFDFVFFGNNFVELVSFAAIPSVICLAILTQLAWLRMKA